MAAPPARRGWFGRPNKRPKVTSAAITATFGLGFMATVVVGSFWPMLRGEHTIDALPAAFGLLVSGLFASSGLRDLYWARKLRHVSDEEIEHRAAIEQVGAGPLPTVPVPKHTPGKRGYLLTATHDLGPGFVFLVLFALVWLIPCYLTFGDAWQLGFFMVVAITVEAILVFFIGRQILVHLRIRPTDIEVSAHPVAAGERFTLTFTQHGPLRTNSLDVRLVCEEEVRYQVGTDTRTEANIVFEQPLISEIGLDIPMQRPFHTSLEIEVPADAMHSFDAPSNVVRWKLITRGDVPSFPDFQRTAELVVVPARPAAGGYRARGRT